MRNFSVCRNSLQTVSCLINVFARFRPQSLHLISWLRGTGCVTIDFTNSILFEPLSDNFPGIDFGMCKFNAKSWHFFFAFQVAVVSEHGDNDDRQWKDEDKEQLKELFDEPVAFFFLQSKLKEEMKNWRKLKDFDAKRCDSRTWCWKQFLQLAKTLCWWIWNDSTVCMILLGGKGKKMRFARICKIEKKCVWLHVRVESEKIE